MEFCAVTPPPFTVPSEIVGVEFDEQEIEWTLLEGIQYRISLQLLEGLLPEGQLSQEFWILLEENRVQLLESHCNLLATKQANIPDPGYIMRMIEENDWKVTSAFLMQSYFPLPSLIYNYLGAFPADEIDQVVAHLLLQGTRPTCAQVAGLLCAPCKLDTLVRCLRHLLAEEISVQEQGQLLSGAAVSCNPALALQILDDKGCRLSAGVLEQILWGLNQINQGTDEFTSFMNVLLKILQNNPDPANYTQQVLNMALFFEAPDEIIDAITERMEIKKKSVFASMLVERRGRQALLAQLEFDTSDQKALDLFLTGSFESLFGPGFTTFSAEVFNLLLYMGLPGTLADQLLNQGQEINYLTSSICIQRQSDQALVFRLNQHLFG